MNEKAVFAFKEQKAKAAAFSAQANWLVGLVRRTCGWVGGVSACSEIRGYKRFETSSFYNNFLATVVLNCTDFWSK